MSSSASDVAAWSSYESAVWARGLAYYRARLRSLDVRTNGSTVLDLGCGPGQWATAAEAEGCQVIACDQKPRRVSREGRRFHLVGSDAALLPFQDASFDLVLCNLVLPYVPVEPCLAEIRRVLRPRGWLFGICHGPGYYLLQALRECRHSPRGAARRLKVLGYTAAHDLLGLRSYRYETYQHPARIQRTLERLGFTVRWVREGGHPLMPEKRRLGLTVFFEFLTSR